MKVTYARGLDPKAAHAKIAGIHTPSIASVEDYIFKALTKRLFHLPKKNTGPVRALPISRQGQT